MDSATQITVTISIGDSASAGARDVSVTTPGGTTSKTGGFTVVEASPTEEEDSSGGFPVWGWVLVGLGAVILIGPLAYAVRRSLSSAG